MNLTVVREATAKQSIAGKPVVVTCKLHSINPDGLRTIRVQYLENMPLQAGGWLADTVTETVVDGVGRSKKTLIPEHRVQ